MIHGDSIGLQISIADADDIRQIIGYLKVLKQSKDISERGVNLGNEQP